MCDGFYRDIGSFHHKRESARGIVRLGVGERGVYTVEKKAHDW